MTASTPARLPQRSHARSNRARILAVAREEFSRDPDASLDEIARAAGVVRRTLYGHFPNRQALLAALAEEASAALQDAVAASRHPGDDPPTALARTILAIWPVGDRYRMLIALGRCDLGEETINAALGPSRAAMTSILERGQRDGTFPDCLPAPLLAQALQSFGVALLESNHPDPEGEAGATAMLMAAGVDSAAARACLRKLLHDRQVADQG
jgi:AcrR family transcriptional regulator